MVRERRGTCSTKHLFLARELARRFPETEPQIVHRVYRLGRDDARQLFGEEAAAVVPESGLADVHRYLSIRISGRCIALDVTFPVGPRWDGHSSLPLACGEGLDYPAGGDPDADKRALEAAHCDPSVREPFIAALVRLPPEPGHVSGEVPQTALTAERAQAALGAGALLIDIRSGARRERDGEIPGSRFVARNVLQWRCGPASPSRDTAIAGQARGRS